MTYVEDHMRQTLSDYVLTCTAATRSFAAYRLGPDANTGMGVVRILFTSEPLVEQIIITGDLCPGDNGVISNAGYGIGWFGSPKSEHYLCEKFFREEYVPMRAREALVEVQADHGAGELELTEKQLEMLHDALTDSLEPNSGDPSNPVRSHEAFYDLWCELFDTGPDDRGFDYDQRTAGWLCAIQQRFAELYQEAAT